MTTFTYSNQAYLSKQQEGICKEEGQKELTSLENFCCNKENIRTQFPNGLL